MMEKFKKKVSSILYNFNTEDRYAGFQAHQKAVETPFQTRLTNGSTAYINASLTAYPEDNLGSTDDFHGSGQGHGDLSKGEGVKEVELAWRHIRTWTSRYQPDLREALSAPCTERDLIEAQKDMQVALPECVVRSMRTHDGQDSMPGTNGLVFGLELMDLDSVVKMNKMWRKVNDRVHNDAAQKVMLSKIGNLSQPQLSHKSSNNLSQASRINNYHQQENAGTAVTNATQKKYKTDLPKQSSIPPGAVQATYAHPQWIPLLTDNAGNHIGVDLAPGPKGKWGQVIVFGREFDTKYVLAPNWGDFLLIFANDLELKNWRIEGDEDNYVGNGELIFNDRVTGKDRVYFAVLVERSVKVYRTELAQMKQRPDLKPLPRTPDLIDASSPVVNEVEVFPDQTQAKQVKRDADEDAEVASTLDDVAL